MSSCHELTAVLDGAPPLIAKLLQDSTCSHTLGSSVTVESQVESELRSGAVSAKIKHLNYYKDRKKLVHGHPKDFAIRRIFSEMFIV